jgi:hypothetical protein
MAINFSTTFDLRCLSDLNKLSQHLMYVEHASHTGCVQI